MESLSQEGEIDIQEENPRITGKFLALVICVPIATVLVVCGIILFTLYFRKRDQKTRSAGDFGNRNDVYESVDDAQRAKEHDFGFGYFAK